MSTPEWTSVLPPVLAIALAILTRQVHLSLFVGIWLGTTLLAGGQPLVGLADALDGCITVFADAGNTKVIAFSALVGALIALTRASGGVAGFVRWIVNGGWVATARRARLLSWTIGVIVFVESSMTSLVNGAICRPLFDRLGISRETLAYLCDATAAPICILIPLNAWGAYLTQIMEQEGQANPVGTLFAAMPYNVYAILAIVMAFYFAYTGRFFGALKAADARVEQTGALFAEGAEPMIGQELTAIEPPEGIELRARNFLLPVGVMVAMMPTGLYITGGGDLMRGSGSTAVFWAVLAGVATAFGLALLQGSHRLSTLTEVFFKGLGGLMPLALLMVLAFALGAVAKDLGTGKYVAQLANEGLPTFALPAVVFVLACGIAFSTGTSWGTFAIMVPIAIDLGRVVPGADAVMIGAALGGGIFGDHCSPISDTTIISSMSAGCDHIDHVRSQLPYALIAAGGSLIAYLAIGLTL